MKVLDRIRDDFRYSFYGFADFDGELATIVDAIEGVGIGWLFAADCSDRFAEQSANEKTDADASQIVLIIIPSLFNYMCCFARTDDDILQFRLIVEIQQLHRIPAVIPLKAEWCAEHTGFRDCVPDFVSKCSTVHETPIDTLCYT